MTIDIMIFNKVKHYPSEIKSQLLLIKEKLKNKSINKNEHKILLKIKKELERKRTFEIKQLIDDFKQNKLKKIDFGLPNRKKERLRYQNDIQWRLRKILRSRLNCLKNNKKSNSTLKLVGCSLLQLKQYLEQTAPVGFTWEQYGRNGYHIDHIIPCSAFDFSKSKEQQQCFHYTNLRIMWGVENQSKTNKYNPIDKEKYVTFVNTILGIPN